MCNKCEAFARGMTRAAQNGGPQFGARPASDVIAKFNFSLTRLPTDMVFTHATSRTPAETQASGGFDPAFSSEICYNGDSHPGHEQWFDRMTFAADAGKQREKLSKVAQMQGYGTDKLKQGGHQYAYIFEAPKGTTVRSTKGGFDGEICFPEPIPFEWITEIHQVVQPGGGQPRGYITMYLRH